MAVSKTSQRPLLYSDPEWEAEKASRRNLRHGEAVKEAHHLSTQYRRMWDKMASFEIDLMELVGKLREKKIPFVLTGAHGIASWTGRPRATYDVGILVRRGRNHTRAVKALQVLYPQLEVRHVTNLVRFYVPGEKDPVIDVVAPFRADQEATLASGVWIKEQGEKYRIPTLEEALANKYGAMLSTVRSAGKRGQDMIDFFWMVTHSQDEGRQPLDEKRLSELGEMVWPGGGGKEILDLVAQGRTGEVPVLNTKPRLEP